MVDAGASAQGAVAFAILLDLLDLLVGVAEAGKRLVHRLVDDLEVAAARELLELDDGKLRLDARGIAIHNEADGAGRSDHTHLRVAETVLLALL